jgi:hypothetical protein
MTNRPKDIGTAAETAVVRALRRHGFPHAERRALRGEHDAGDIAGTPGVCWSVKGGEAAKSASDNQVERWLSALEKQQVNARADLGVLVLQRKGVGGPNADRWWAVRLVSLEPEAPCVIVRTTLRDMCWTLRAIGYGQPIDSES